MLRTATFAAFLCSLFALGSAPATCPPTYENLNAVLWMQTSVEYKASAVQTYRLAQVALVHALHDPNWTAALEQTGDFQNLPPAVILDLDETVLDNSVFNARAITSPIPKGEFDAKWAEWMTERRAGLVPGAKEFLEFANAVGVVPIYITNRVCHVSQDDDPTVQQLRNLDLPLDPVAGRLFCAKNTAETDKTGRRRMCATKFRILLQFGDQLGDFLQIPANSADLGGREKLFLAHQSMWGERWFQLPNPTYGSWEGAVGYSVQDKLKHLRQ
jgi:5'-nucleotidase (lipoprotein e(P4) family)